MYSWLTIEIIRDLLLYSFFYITFFPWRTCNSDISFHRTFCIVYYVIWFMMVVQISVANFIRCWYIPLFFNSRYFFVRCRWLLVFSTALKQLLTGFHLCILDGTVRFIGLTELAFHLNILFDVYLIMEHCRRRHHHRRYVFYHHHHYQCHCRRRRRTFIVNVFRRTEKNSKKISIAVLFLNETSTMQKMNDTNI